MAVKAVKAVKAIKTVKIEIYDVLRFFKNDGL